MASYSSYKKVCELKTHVAEVGGNMNIEQEINMLIDEIDDFDSKMKIRLEKCVMFKGRYMTTIKDDVLDDMKKERAKKFDRLMKLMKLIGERKKRGKLFKC